MPYISNRLKERLFDELRDVLRRLASCQQRERVVRNELAAIVQDRRELERTINAIQKEVITGEAGDELPIMAAERARAIAEGEIEPSLDAVLESESAADGRADRLEADVQAAMGRTGRDLVTSRPGSTPSSNGHPELEARAWGPPEDEGAGKKPRGRKAAAPSR